MMHVLPDIPCAECVLEAPACRQRSLKYKKFAFMRMQLATQANVGLPVLKSLSVFEAHFY